MGKKLGVIMADFSLGYLTKFLPSTSHKSFILDASLTGEKNIGFKGADGLEGLVIAPVRLGASIKSKGKADYLEIALSGDDYTGEDNLLRTWDWNKLETTPGGLILVSPGLVGEILGPTKSKFGASIPDRINRDVFVINCDDHVELWNPSDWKRY